MTSLSEILIIRGFMPITSLDSFAGDTAADEAAVRELVEGGIVTESQVASARAAQLGLPFVDLTEFPVEQTAVALAPGPLLRRHNVLPIARDGDRADFSVRVTDRGETWEALPDVLCGPS